LRAIHKFAHLNAAFYGINYGSLGFLLNPKISVNELPLKIKNAAEVKINMLKIQIETDAGTMQSFAVNEATLFRAGGQVAKIRIFIDGKMRIEELAADGVCLSTPAGSTAYNFSLHGPILPREANLISLCPISPFRPRHFRGALLSFKSEVKFEALSHKSRPVIATADFKHFENVKTLTAGISDKDYIRILFENEDSLKEKILTEQFCH
jgi:NAD+ kinase